MFGELIQLIRHNLRGLIIILTLALTAVWANGQLYTGRQSDSIVSGTQKVKVDQQSGQIEYFELSSGALKSGYVINGEIIKRKVGLPNAYKLVLSNEQFDSNGGKHAKYQLFLDDIHVEGLGYSVHYQDGIARSVNGKVVSSSLFNSNVAISEISAIEKAISLFNSKEFVWDTDNSLYPKAELLYIPQDSLLTLCYKIDIYSVRPLQREYVYINAQTGDVVKRISRIHNVNYLASAESLYNGLVQITTNQGDDGYILNEDARGNGIFTYSLNHGQLYSNAEEIVDVDNYWDDIDNRVAYDAHYGAEKTYDYFSNKFGRNSIDNNGLALKSYVHYGENYANAFWDGDRMTYGDGDGYSKTAYASLDIVGHEISHGLTSYTADLEYSYESGALNESFSDIFGVAIDFYARPTKANYLIGEQIYVDGTSYMRSMGNPKSVFHPNTYKGDYWITESSDHGGVHTNSAIQNYWFYLLCEGGSGINDNGDSYMVKSIGIEAAESIAYRNLTVYLSRYSDYEDARFYSIQAAIDLYGNCSNELIQVTNAWYAVGVGLPFNNAVTAAFTTQQSDFCSSPASVYLESISTHAESYKWYLNETKFSTEQNPSLLIENSGDYHIRLEVEGTSDCNTSDVVEIENYITVSDIGTPIPATYAPTSIHGGKGGIYSVKLNQINHHSRGADESYIDFSCGNRTVLTEGKKYNISIRTGADSKEAVGIWLDINNDGIFSNSAEKIFSSISTTHHFAEIKVPAGQVFNTPLRLRVGSDNIDYAESLDAQNNSQYGQYEDYAVILEKNMESPVAKFSISDTIVIANGVLEFMDLSENLSTDRSWHFQGGEPAQSSDANPSVTFAQEGDYEIELTVNNEYGSSTLSKQIRVVKDHVLGVNTMSSLSSGYVYDSGGENGNYQNDVEHKFIISPYCAKEIQLTIESFKTESCCDYLKIYDGKDINATLLAELKGAISTPSSFKATSGSMLLVFKSDGSVSDEGFKARWGIEGITTGKDVKADFSIDPEIIPVNFDLDFLDNSQDKPSIWNWNFGTGNTSNKQNPKYRYKTAGNYEVQLVVDNCVSKDTLKKQIIVNSAPELSLVADTIRIDILSGEKIDSFISISNLNNGLLAYEGKLLNTYEKGNSNNPIKYNSFAPDFEGITVGLAKNVFYYGDLKNVLMTNGAVCTQILSTNISTSLNTLDVLIVDDSSNFLVSNKNEIKAWVNKGGFFIIQGDGITDDYNEILAGTGISYLKQDANEGNAVILSHKITDAISQYIIGNHAECILNVTTPAVTLLNDVQGNCYAALAELGKGKIVAMGDESLQYMYNVGHEQFFIGALKHCTAALNADVCQIKEGYSFVEGVSVDSLKYIIDSNKLIEGDYVVDVQVNSNDSQLGVVNVPILLSVTGIENIETDVVLLSYGDVLVNEAKWLKYKIKNTGTRNLSISNIDVNSQVFSVAFTPLDIKPGEIYSFDVKFAPTTNQNFRDELKIHSSDPDMPIYKIALQGNAILPPELTNPIGDKTIYLGYDERIDLNTIFSDPDNHLLIFEAASLDGTVVRLTLENSSILKLNPLKEGNTSITITATNSNNISITHTFNLEVRRNNSPVYSMDVDDKFFDINDPAYVVNLNEHFRDMDGDEISYYCSVSSGGIVGHSISEGLLELSPLSEGSTQVTLIANDGYGGETSITFNAYVGISTSVDDINLSKLVQMYPNPVSALLHIKINNVIIRIDILDISGNRVSVPSVINSNIAQVNVSILPKGVYLVNIVTNKNEYSEKIVKE